MYDKMLSKVELHELKLQFARKHYKTEKLKMPVSLTTGKQYYAVFEDIESELSNPSIWSELIELLDYFMINYLLNGKIVIKWYQINKHRKMLGKLKSFFERAYSLIFKNK